MNNNDLYKKDGLIRGWKDNFLVAGFYGLIGLFVLFIGAISAPLIAAIAAVIYAVKS